MRNGIMFDFYLGLPHMYKYHRLTESHQTMQSKQVHEVMEHQKPSSKVGMTYDTFIPCLHLVPFFTHTINIFTQMSAAFPLSINSQHTGKSSFLHTTCMHYRLNDAHSTLLWREQHLVPRLLLKKWGGIWLQG